MSLHYLVKLSGRALRVNSYWNYEPKTHRMFLSVCHIVHKTRNLKKYAGLRNFVRRLIVFSSLVLKPSFSQSVSLYKATHPLLRFI